MSEYFELDACMRRVNYLVYVGLGCTFHPDSKTSIMQKVCFADTTIEIAEDFINNLAKELPDRVTSKIRFTFMINEFKKYINGNSSFSENELIPELLKLEAIIYFDVKHLLP